MEIDVTMDNLATVLDQTVKADVERALAENDLGMLARIRSFRGAVQALADALSACAQSADGRPCTTEEESKGIIEGMAMALVAVYAPQVARQVPACEHRPPCGWMAQMEQIAMCFHTKMLGHTERYFEEAVKTGITQPHQGTA